MNSMLNINLDPGRLFDFYSILWITSIIVFLGLIAGLYPAFYLTSFEPVSMLKNIRNSVNAKPAFRRNMVIIQFIISITLIIGMFTVYQQMQFIRNKNLGFDKENVVILPVRSQQVGQSFNAFRDALLDNPKIVAVAASGDIPSNRIYGDTNYADKIETDKSFSMKNIFIGYDFVETYKMEVLAGRHFSRDFASDTAGTVMVNETALQKFGWTPEQIVGRELKHRRGQVSKVVGVLKNFNFKSIHKKIEPLVIMLYPDYVRAISVRIASGNLSHTLDYIRGQWKNMFPGEQFDFSFLDRELNALYAKEKNTQNIFLLFSFLSLFVACLGLFGLTAFTADERTKEIGVRKVLGASTSNIVIGLLKEILKWVVLSTIIAWPVAWYAMQSWLQNFAYKVELSIWMFLGAFILALTIALFSVSWQAIQAATANPVNSLRTK
jgi:putative ABC transport system permease protein